MPFISLSGFIDHVFHLDCQVTYSSDYSYLHTGPSNSRIFFMKLTLYKISSLASPDITLPSSVLNLLLPLTQSNLFKTIVINSNSSYRNFSHGRELGKYKEGLKCMTSSSKHSGGVHRPLFLQGWYFSFVC